MSALSTRVIGPVLPGVAQGYRHAQRVGQVIFPESMFPGVAAG